METVENATENGSRAQLNAAVAAVMSKVKRLEKADNNAFAKYRFTSVDDYKDFIRPLMAENGLAPCVSQVGFSTFESKKDSIQCQFDFELWLEHESGEVGAREGSTICLPYTGAQTTGQARSYVVKEWLKSKFLASSGDLAEDADATAFDIQLTKAQAREVYDRLTTELRDAHDKKALNTWAERNSVLIDAMPNDWKVNLRHEYKQAQLGLKVAEAAPPVEASDLVELMSEAGTLKALADLKAQFDQLRDGVSQAVQDEIEATYEARERALMDAKEAAQAAE